MRACAMSDISMLMMGGARRSFFFFNDTATTEIYTLSLHDALPICAISWETRANETDSGRFLAAGAGRSLDRKSTRLNSSHQIISYAVFCLKKKRHILVQQHVYTRPLPQRPIHFRHRPHIVPH